MAAPQQDVAVINPFIENLPQLVKLVDARSVPPQTDWKDILNVVVRIGATTFALPGANDKPVQHDELTGILIHAKRYRLYYTVGYNEDKDARPECVSNDAITGEGTPGGHCADCALGQFIKNGKGGWTKPSCQLRMYLYLLMPGMDLPIRVKVPPTSVANVSRHLANLKKMQLLPWQLPTTLTVGAQMSKGKKEQTVIKLASGGTRFDPMFQTQVAEYRNAFVSFVNFGESQYADENESSVFMETNYTDAAPAAASSTKGKKSDVDTDAF